MSVLAFFSFMSLGEKLITIRVNHVGSSALKGSTVSSIPLKIMFIFVRSVRARAKLVSRLQSVYRVFRDMLIMIWRLVVWKIVLTLTTEMKRISVFLVIRPASPA